MPFLLPLTRVTNPTSDDSPKSPANTFQATQGASMQGQADLMPSTY